MLVNAAHLLSPQQRTLARPTQWVEGTTLRGHPARLRFLPAAAYEGRSLLVTHRENEVFHLRSITLSHGAFGKSWTDLLDRSSGRGVGVIEHPAAAVVLAGLDNVIIHVDYPDKFPVVPFYKKGHGKVTSVPLLDGTARHYLEAIDQAGTVQVGAKRAWYTVASTLSFTVDGNRFVLRPRTRPGWSMSVSIQPSTAKWWAGQHTQLAYDTDDLDASHTLARIATARPMNSNGMGWLMFRLLTLGTGRKANFAALHNPWGKLVDTRQPPYKSDEAVNHRHLDLLGDLPFFGGWWQVDMEVYQGRHAATAKFRRFLLHNDHRFIPV